MIWSLLTRENICYKALMLTSFGPLVAICEISNIIYILKQINTVVDELRLRIRTKKTKTQLTGLLERSVVISSPNSSLSSSEFILTTKCT